MCGGMSGQDRPQQELLENCGKRLLTGLLNNSNEWCRYPRPLFQVQGSQSISRGSATHLCHHLLSQRSLVCASQNGPLGYRPFARRLNWTSYSGRWLFRYAYVLLLHWMRCILHNGFLLQHTWNSSWTTTLRPIQRWRLFVPKRGRVWSGPDCWAQNTRRHPYCCT